MDDNLETREAGLEQLEQISGRYPTKERFLTELTLDPPAAAGDQAGEPLLDEDYLILSTVHSAKGQEWSALFVFNVADGNFPSEFATGKPKMIEAERRLLYVAMTRAKPSRPPQKCWTCGPPKFDSARLTGSTGWVSGE